LDHGFFGIPHWYQFLPGTLDASNKCIPQITSINDIWLIVAAVIEMLLRVAAIAAIVFVIWGGIEFIRSQGEPDATTRARNTVFNALIGLVIAVVAATAVTFFAGQFN
jgi:ABC-type Fe3+ transport system permease subunit